VNLFNPERIVFNHRMAGVADLIMEPVKQVIRRQALAVTTRQLKVCICDIGAEAAVLGAATVVLDHFFRIPEIPRPEFMAG
jgi:hypothetical protein